MITHKKLGSIRYFVASGALAFDGKGWFWERWLVWLGFIKLRYFTVVLKSLTLNPRKGNLRWWKPWECVRLIKGGAVNKVGLTNKGFDWWMKKVAPKLDFKNQSIVISLFGTKEEIVTMIRRLNGTQFNDVTAIELNDSCPNSGHAKSPAESIVSTAKAARHASHHNLILKIAADQDGVAIVHALVGVVQAISFNSLKHEIVFPEVRSPLHPLEKRVGGGGGGVSGKPLQKHNWALLEKIHHEVPEMRLIASSIMEQGDIEKVERLGARGFSFGTIHLPDYDFWRKPWTIFTNPCRATKIVEKDMRRMRSEAFLDNSGFGL